MRTIASGRGLSIEQHAANLCDNPNQGIDEGLDQCVADFGRQNYVIGEGRLLHITFPRAFKVRLVCDIDICAMRRSGQECGDEFEAVKAALIERNKNDCLRYDSIYGRAWNWPDLAFDCVLDTGSIGKDDMVQTILKLHRDWCSRLDLVDRIFHDICHPTYRLDMNRLRIGN